MRRKLTEHEEHVVQGLVAVLRDGTVSFDPPGRLFGDDVGLGRLEDLRGYFAANVVPEVQAAWGKVLDVPEPLDDDEVAEVWDELLNEARVRALKGAA